MPRPLPDLTAIRRWSTRADSTSSCLLQSFTFSTSWAKGTGNRSSPFPTWDIAPLRPAVVTRVDCHRARSFNRLTRGGGTRRRCSGRAEQIAALLAAEHVIILRRHFVQLEQPCGLAPSTSQSQIPPENMKGRTDFKPGPSPLISGYDSAIEAVKEADVIGGGRIPNQTLPT